MELHHLAFRVADLEKSLLFYREVLAFDLVENAAPDSAWLKLGDHAVLMLETRRPDEPRLAEGSLELAAFRVVLAEKDRVREVARAHGWYDGETDHTVYLRDPDGRRVAVSTYPL